MANQESELTVEEARTVKYYDEHSEEWASKHSGGTMFDSEMELLFDLLPEGTILEVGTGTGEDAKKLIKHYGVSKYWGVDRSAGLLKIAKKRNPGANLSHLSIYSLDKLDRKFDGFWISAMLIHVHKNKLQTALKVLQSVLNEGAVGFISIMEGDADMEESRPGRHYSLWMPDEFERELVKAQFEVIKFRRIETDASPWLAYLLKRN